MGLKPPLVYVAGQISGDPWGCVRQATEVFPLLRELGAVPFLPQLSVVHALVRPVSYEDFMAYDFDVIRLSDALIRLEGHSPGADREVDFANDLGIPVFFFDDVLSRSAFHRWISTRTEEADRC